ncbi:hypothetical protein [Chachezhania sediminis]|uniref:hypothetical protein n=1 Tax=Chachezhania sediminis TaxID=2599291 RepID=UPI00131C592C|nr:hypothetical protein [Chachezhania sediminis]
MIRKELCAIAGMKVPTFNSHRANGDLPFILPLSEAEDRAGRTWSNFTIHEAARMLAARHLVDANGVTWSEAASILREPGALCGPSGPGHRYFDRAGIFVAAVQFSNARTNAVPTLFPESKLYEGPLDRIISAAQADAEAYNEQRHAFGEQICVVSVVSVDLSHHYRLAHGLAKQMGIALDGEYAPDPTGD